VESTIYLQSNIYPIRDENIINDVQYLAHILTGLKMVRLEEKFPHINFESIWTPLQKDLKKSKWNDHTNGIVYENNEYKFVKNQEIVIEEKDYYDKKDYDYEYSKNNYVLKEVFIPHGYTELVPNESNNDSSMLKIQEEKSLNHVKLLSILKGGSDNIVKEIGALDKPQQNEELIYNGTLINTNIKAENTQLFDKVAQLGITDENISETILELDQSPHDKEINEESVIDDLPIEDNIESQDINLFDKFEEVEQEEIITFPSNEVIFVDAGPGTGKTYTLLKRIEYLVKESEEPEYAESILVLCFTHAAVNEIKDRLNIAIKNGADRSLANVDIRTFDSFATWLLSQARELGWLRINFNKCDFDQRIKLASKIMENKTYFEQVVSGWNHFIVDEIQDLTNSRARFVLLLINACLNKTCGITVLGDSCQAIYDYTIREIGKKEIPMSSQSFYDALSRKIESIGYFLKITKNHRQVNALIDFSIEYRNSILKQNIEFMKQEVKNIENKIISLENDSLTIDVNDLTEKILKTSDNLNILPKICFVCRSNEQTLTLSSDFRKRQIKHILNVDLTKENYAPWISEIFLSFSGISISSNEFISLYNNTDNHSLSPEIIWSRILILLKERDEVNVKKLLRAINISKIDDTCFRIFNESNIIVSNIHKTKGREYDCVIVDDSFISDLIKRDQEIGEYKTLYVAITRPKKYIASTSLSRRKGADYMRKLPIYETKRKRCLKYTTKVRRIINKIEFLSEIDINKESYIITETGKIQEYLSNISIGDQIVLKKFKKSNIINYQIVHNDTIIGFLNESLVQDLVAFMALEGNSIFVELPDRISDLYVSGKYTYIADEDYLKDHPNISKLSPNGVWQWVEFIGIGLAAYDIY
jgi:hypothetical protein